jgi:molybdate transport system substrate-binding protein
MPPERSRPQQFAVARPEARRIVGLVRSLARRARVVLGLGALLVALAACRDAAAPPPAARDTTEPLVVAVAANFATTAQQLAAMFEREAGRAVVISVGSSGLLQRQAREGAPFDLFLSADTHRIDELSAEGVIAPESVAIYAEGTLVLWHPGGAGGASVDDDNDLPLRWGDLGAAFADPAFRLAMANPAHAPYGLAGEQAMKAAAISPARGQIIVMEDIRQAWQVAASGNANVALVPLSLVLEREEGAWEEVPRELYTPIRQALGRLSAAPHADAAEALRLFLLSAAAREVIAASGYGAPPPPTPQPAPTR